MLMVVVMGFAQYPQATFQVPQSASTRDVQIGRQLSQNEQIALADMPPIYALSVSGSVNFTSPSGYVSVLLVDELGHEYMVYESYPLLAESNSFDVDHMAFETAVLAGVKGKSVKVNVRDCLFNLQSLTADYSNQSTYARTASVVRAEQAKVLVDQLNHNLEKQQYAWRARVTAVSKLPYEQKKQMMGLDLSRLPGFEYYSGGIYCTPDVWSNRETKSSSDDVYARYADIDWRNVHGKNWMTPAKEQNMTVCWVFAAVGGLEAYANRYFNQNLQLDLSEQDVFTSVKGRNMPSPDDTIAFRKFWPGFTTDALDTLKSKGVVDEDCLPYSILDLRPLPCANPKDIVKIEGYDFNSKFYGKTDELILKELLKAPIIIGFCQDNVWYNPKSQKMESGQHAVVLAGKKSLKLGDVISLSPMTEDPKLLTLDKRQESLFGRTSWLFKNSYGTDWGDNGYCYMIESRDTYIDEYMYLKGKVISKLYKDADIQCVDEDGDGYFTWGLREEPPASLPQWASRYKDGDDSDPEHVTLDNWGHPQKLKLSTQNISELITWNQPSMKYHNYVIEKGGELVISSETRMHTLTKIVVKDGGKLVIDANQLIAPEIQLEKGAQLEIKNNGVLQLIYNKIMSVEKGAIIEISNGEIK